MIKHPTVRRVLFAIYVLASVLYVGWRLGWTLNLEQPVYALMFFFAEAFCILSSLVFYKVIVVRPPAAQPPESADHAPTVDVFIATYNEELELVRTTAVAARDMAGDHTTWICDDGRREEMRRLAEELGVGYLTRPDNSHAKAGNLNNALAHSSGELVLVLDADHVLRRQALQCLAPHFADPTVGLVQTPQVYYNVDSYQHAVSRRKRILWHEAAIFHHLMQPGASRLNAAFFVGTGALLRRSALDEVGGFATGSITEDIHTSMRLHAAGYRSVYVDQALGFLLAPDTPLAYCRQRLRWAQGSMQLLRRENPLTKPGLSFWQRVAYMNSLGGYLAAYQHVIFYLAPAIYLLWGMSPIAVDPVVGFPLFVAHIVFDLIIYKLLAAPYARLFLSECFKLLSVALFVRASTTLLSNQDLPFRVTPKGRNAGLPLDLVALPLVLFVFNITAVGLGLVRLLTGPEHVGAVVLTTFFAMLFSVAGALALVHAYERRGSDESFAFQVCFEASPGLEIHRLNHEVAYGVATAALTRGLTAGQTLDLDLTPLGIGRLVGGRVLAIAEPRRGATDRVVKLALDSLHPRERDALDRCFFQTAVPRLLADMALAPDGPPPEALPGREIEVETGSFLAVRTGLI